MVQANNPAFGEIFAISNTETARGGVLVALAERFALPVHAIGVGESAEDLRTFKAQDFANSLMGLGD